MRLTQSNFAALACGLLLAVAAQGALAGELSTTEQGIEFISGGVGESEQSAIQEQKGRYSLWLVTAAKGSGAYLSDVQVKVVDARRKMTVLEHTMEGPWLFAALPPGRYTVEAIYRNTDTGTEQSIRKVAMVTKGKNPRQMVLYFDSADTVRAAK